MSIISEQIMIIRSAKKRIAEIEQQLAEKDKQLFEENLQVKRLEAQLSRYQGGVEVDGCVCMQECGASIPGLSTILLKYPADVRVLVLPKQG